MKTDLPILKTNVLFSPWFNLYFGLAWLGASVVGGAVLAYLTKRIHASISFKKNWLYFSTLLAVSGFVIFGVVLR